MKKSELKQIIKLILKESLILENIQDPTKEEMLSYLQKMYGREEGFKDDAEVAIYWFANFYHGGQSSNLYSALSTSRFRPGPIARGPEKDSSEKMMYDDLVFKFAPGSDEAQEIQQQYNSLNENSERTEKDDLINQISDDYKTLHGMRPRGTKFYELDVPSLKRIADELSKDIHDMMEREKSDEKQHQTATKNAMTPKSWNVGDITGLKEDDEKKCQKCKGNGHYTTQLKDRSGKNNHGLGNTHIVPCDASGCKNGKSDPEGYYRSMMEENGQEHLINGQSNNIAASRVNKVLASLSKGIFSDNSWEAIHKIFEKLRELGLDVSILSAKYGGQQDTSNNMPKYKEWQISIPFTNKAGKPMELVGPITAHGAGSIEQPLDRYDVTAYVSAIPARKV